MTLNMSTISGILAAGVMLSIVTGCGKTIDTGRNSDPSKWPATPDPGSTDDRSPSNGRGASRTTCFETGTEKIPDHVAKLCNEQIQSEPAFNSLYPIICEQGKLIAALNQPACGWDGQPESIQRYIHHYYVQKDASLDYEDIHASLVTVPVPSHKFMTAIRLAFENYDEFKRQGMQWVSGTREHRNINGTTWEQGITYRFRADKEAYEIGYQGFNKVFQLSPTLWVHLNHATGDFARISEFSQIVFYQQHPNDTSSSFKIEHRKVLSQGYFELARKSSQELIRDVMEKGYRNATK